MRNFRKLGKYLPSVVLCTSYYASMYVSRTKRKGTYIKKRDRGTFDDYGKGNTLLQLPRGLRRVSGTLLLVVVLEKNINSQVWVACQYQFPHRWKCTRPDRDRNHIGEGRQESNSCGLFWQTLAYWGVS